MAAGGTLLLLPSPGSRPLPHHCTAFPSLHHVLVGADKLSYPYTCVDASPDASAKKVRGGAGRGEAGCPGPTSARKRSCQDDEPPSLSVQEELTTAISLLSQSLALAQRSPGPHVGRNVPGSVLFRLVWTGWLQCRTGWPCRRRCRNELQHQSQPCRALRCRPGGRDR